MMIYEKQERDIRLKKDKQDITLRNINYELMKLNHFNKPIMNLK